ncbi:MAG: NAD(P)H-hydrate dehydratase [Betaproteobacteria bacterium]|nr:MAG: NAD(P)H-hydrate dehydratase [Betaproteobacteria bacterium]
MHTVPVYLTEHIRSIEQWAFGLEPPPPLMERAGRAAAELVRRVAPEGARRILVLAGPGNNGGDAFVAARYLKQWWFDVHVVFTGDAAKLKEDAKAAHDDWQKLGGTVSPAIPVDFDWRIAVDGLFGIGLLRDLDERHAELVQTLNESDKPVVAIDVPSGLDADSGKVMGVAVRAGHTITFLGLKAGLHTLDGPDHAGEIHLEGLGIENPPLPDGHGYLIGDEVVAATLPGRVLNSHKGRFGDVVIIGGASGMVGAALLAGRAALKLGAGRVLVGMLGEGPSVDFVQPDLMLRSVEELLARENIGAAVIGPGLGQSDAALHALSKGVRIDAPIILDADALNIIATSKALKTTLQQRTEPTLLTPHPAEAGRLLGLETAAVQEDRIAIALDLASEFNAAVVLKGCGSICGFPEGTWCINTSGNPGMASAGMGDVLSGILGALLAQGAAAHSALLAGVYVHGVAADELVAKGVGPVGLTASETVDAARSIWNRLASE